MSLRENIKTERVARIDRLAKSSQPVGCVPGLWLACYPIFQDALQSGETTFRALPDYAKSPVLQRTASAPSASSAFVNEVRVAYVELSTACVAETVESYLLSAPRNEEIGYERSTILETIAAQFAATNVPLIARPPCLLSPGQGIFLDGWARFFAYWSRNDKTIPILAVDWHLLYERLTA